MSSVANRQDQINVISVAKKTVAGTGDWTQKYCLPCCQVLSSHLEAPNGFSHFEIFQWIIYPRDIPKI